MSSRHLRRLERLKPKSTSEPEPFSSDENDDISLKEAESSFESPKPSSGFHLLEVNFD